MWEGVGNLQGPNTKEATENQDDKCKWKQITIAVLENRKDFRFELRERGHRKERREEWKEWRKVGREEEREEGRKEGKYQAMMAGYTDNLKGDGVEDGKNTTLYWWSKSLHVDICWNIDHIKGNNYTKTRQKSISAREIVKISLSVIFI